MKSQESSAVGNETNITAGITSAADHMHANTHPILRLQENEKFLILPRNTFTEFLWTFFTSCLLFSVIQTHMQFVSQQSWLPMVK